MNQELILLLEKIAESHRADAPDIAKRALDILTS